MCSGAGNLVASLAGVVPDGLLVFFPSYWVLENCINFWKGSGGGGSACLHRAGPCRPTDPANSMQKLAAHVSCIHH